MMLIEHNSYYGHELVFQEYCNVYDPIQRYIQHGFTVGTDSFFLNDKLTYAVWNNRVAKQLTARGAKAVVVGAPYLYLNEEAPSVNYRANSLLAIPTHSIGQKKLPLNTWNTYLDFIEAKRRSFVDTEILLHPTDYYNEEVARLFIKRGFGAVTCSESLENYRTWGGCEPAFLYYLRRCIKNYSNVSCNRICTAVFYALYEGLKVNIEGPKMKTEPRDFDDELVEDDKWIGDNYPNIASGFGTYLDAKIELGTKLTKEDLIPKLWGEL